MPIKYSSCTAKSNICFNNNKWILVSMTIPNRHVTMTTTNCIVNHSFFCRVVHMQIMVSMVISIKHRATDWVVTKYAFIQKCKGILGFLIRQKNNTFIKFILNFSFEVPNKYIRQTAKWCLHFYELVGNKCKNALVFLFDLFLLGKNFIHRRTPNCFFSEFLIWKGDNFAVFSW